jgi:hypothetical protein
MGKVKVAQLDYLFTFYLTLPRPNGIHIMQHEKTFTTESETQLTSTQNHESDTTEKIVSTTLFYTTSCHCYSPIEEIGCSIVNITNLSYNLKMSRAQDR